MHQTPIEEYCRRLRTDPEHGLTSEEAVLRLKEKASMLSYSAGGSLNGSNSYGN